MGESREGRAELTSRSINVRTESHEVRASLAENRQEYSNGRELRGSTVRLCGTPVSGN